MAAPPPPPVYPDELPREMAGYELPPIYQIYHSWVGRGREPALRDAVRYEENWHGKRHWGDVVSSEINHYDFGVVRIDSLERYCAGDRFRNEPAGECDYRYRYAFVPGSLYSDAAREKLILQSFRPEQLTSLLAREGWQSPGQNELWSDTKLRQVFERHTDLAALYGPQVELHDVRASACPALKQSLEKFDSLTLNIDPAKPGDVNDTPAPHGQQTQVRLIATTPTGGRVTIEGAQPLYKLLEPVWAAVEECSPPSYDRKGASQGSPPATPIRPWPIRP